MKNQPLSIFRDTAAQRHLQEQTAQAMPRIVAPRTFGLLWALLGLLVIAGILTSLVRLPVYTAGQGVILPQEATEEAAGASAGRSSLRIGLYVQAERLGRLEIGQSVLLRLDDTGSTLRASIVDIPIGSPLNSISNQSSTTWPIPAAEIAAVAQLEYPVAPSINRYAEVTYPIRVEIGSRRVISFFPGVSALLESI